MSDEATTQFSRRGLHGQTVDFLGKRIIGGELLPGTLVDPEQIAREMEISRTVVREAIKVLTAKGLLDARPRRGTFVLSRDRWNLLDADVIQWRNADTPDARLMVELEEVRQIIEPWGARLAAQRRLPDQIAALDVAFAALVDASDEKSHVAADIRFHQVMLEGAQNELLERLEMLLEPALKARDELAYRHEHTRQFIDSHRLVLECIREGRADDAFVAMSDLLSSATRDTGENLQRAKLGLPSASDFGFDPRRASKLHDDTSAG
jgi:GntR family galactonate operon transcriptional repressor